MSGTGNCLTPKPKPCAHLPRDNLWPSLRVALSSTHIPAILALYHIADYNMASSKAALLIGEITHANAEWKGLSSLLKLKVTIADL